MHTFERAQSDEQPVAERLALDADPTRPQCRAPAPSPASRSRPRRATPALDPAFEDQVFADANRHDHDDVGAVGTIAANDPRHTQLAARLQATGGHAKTASPTPSGVRPRPTHATPNSPPTSKQNDKTKGPTPPGEITPPTHATPNSPPTSKQPAALKSRQAPPPGKIAGHRSPSRRCRRQPARPQQAEGDRGCQSGGRHTGSHARAGVPAVRVGLRTSCWVVRPPAMHQTTVLLPAFGGRRPRASA